MFFDNEFTKRQLRFPAPPGVTPNYTNPDSIGNEIVVESMTLIAFATVFVALRMFMKLRVIKKHGWDDCKISVPFPSQFYLLKMLQI